MTPHIEQGWTKYGYDQHYALAKSGVAADVVAAFDINSVANACYEHNFPGLKVTRVNVEHLALEYFEKLSVDAWLMSPPCQPFTRGGKRLDAQDARSAGFLYLIGILDALKAPPKYIFIENVLNFEVSQCHERFMAVLRRRGYLVKEFLVSPLDEYIAIPNDRLRYYLAAVRCSEDDASEEKNVKDNVEGKATEIDSREAVDGSGCQIYRSFEEFFAEHPEMASTLALRKRSLGCIGDYVRESVKANKYMVPMKYLTDYVNYRHDIVSALSLRSTTFTKAYGSKHIIGTGSFLQTRHLELDYSPDDRDVLPTLGLRFFSPLEVALLHDFPIESGLISRSGNEYLFKFPPNLSDGQRYRLLGNSMNIAVVCLIFRILFHQVE